MEFNIADLFESVADAIADRLALVSGDRRLTFADLDARANRLAGFLASRGVGKGDHVGLHLYNGSEFVEGMLAAFKLRAVPININYRYVESELSYLCENADLVAIISQRELGLTVAKVAKAAGIRTIVLLADDSTVDLPSAPDVFDYDQALESNSSERRFGPRSGDDLYVIYTGGTTGMPKGVMWRHEDVFFAGLQGGNAGGEPISKPDELAQKAKEGGFLTMLPAAPFIHGAAQWTALICMFGGGKVVIQPGRSFDPKRVVELIGEEKVTTITIVGDAMARPIIEVLESGEHDVSSLMVIASAGAVLSPVVEKRLRELLPNRMILNNFGSTEAGHQGTAMPGAEKGTEGRPSFFMDATNAVFDDQLRPVEPGSGTIGRLARGGRVPLGYYKDGKNTSERFVTVDGKRWVLPGDFATVEADGRITVYGRGSVCINTGGEKVFPEEIEETLKSHPDVFDALVVGIEDDRWMQRVAAVVQPRDDKSPSLETLQAHCRQHIAGYKVPRQLALVDKVSRFPSGKPDYAWAKRIVKGA